MHRTTYLFFAVVAIAAHAERISIVVLNRAVVERTAADELAGHLAATYPADQFVVVAEEVRR